MRIGDTVKAAALAAVILALNLLTSTLAIIVRLLIASGEKLSVIGEWSAAIGGGLLFLAALAWFGRRRPERSAWAFAVRTWIAYVVLDAASGVPNNPPLSFVFSWQMAAAMTVALAGALAGAALARPPRTAVQA